MLTTKQRGNIHWGIQDALVSYWVATLHFLISFSPKIYCAKAPYLLLPPRVRYAKPLVWLDNQSGKVKGNAWFQVVLDSVGKQHFVVVRHHFKVRRIPVRSPSLLLVSSVVHFSSFIKWGQSTGSMWGLNEIVTVNPLAHFLAIDHYSKIVVIVLWN